MLRIAKTYRILQTLLAISLVLFVHGCGHPSDKSIISRFNTNKQSYEKLSIMATKDKHLWRVSHSWYRTSAGENVHDAKQDLLSNERWGKYRSLFNKLDLEDGISIEDGNVYFPISSRSIVGSGSSKGIAFIILKDKIQQSSNNAPHGITYKPIEGNWYLFEDW